MRMDTLCAQQGLSIRVAACDTREIPLARDLTDCVLSFVQDRVTPVAEWVAWTGGDPGLVLILVAETLHSIADGLEPHDVDA